MYNTKLDRILETYFQKIFIMDLPYIVDEIGNIIKKHCLNKKVAIWGAGDHANRLQYYFSNELKDVKYVIDNDAEKHGKTLLGFEIISPDEIKKLDIETILIGSYASAKKIEEQIKQIDSQIISINIYSLLDEKGINLKGAFFDNPGIYIELYNLSVEYKECDEIQEKEVILEKIIYTYLYIRDFKNANYYLKEYIKNNFRYAHQYRKLMQEIKLLLDEMMCKLKEDRKEDIFLILYDALRNEDISKMPYLNELKECGSWFDKAYSPSIYTYESVPCILTGGRDYKERVVKREDCPFAEKAIDLGYTIKVYGIGQWGILDGDGVQHGKSSKYISLTYWNALCDLLEEKNNRSMCVMYIWQETHPPHVGGKHSIEPKSHIIPFTSTDTIEQTQEEYTIQYKEALLYVDQQTKFYFKMLSEDSTKIIFSDHGQIVEEALQPIHKMNTKLGWHTQRYHIPLIISGKNILNRKYDCLFSMLDFPQLMLNILQKEEIALPKREFIQVKFSEMYNNIIIENYKKLHKEDYLYGYEIYLNSEYKIVFTGTGKTILYALKDEELEIKDKNLLEEILSEIKQTAIIDDVSKKYISFYKK